MTIKDKLEDYKRRGQQIRQLTLDTLVGETPEAQQKRIANLLKPENYNAFFQYYFGGNDKYSLSDSPCADFHVRSAKELMQQRVITQFRIWFRGSAKSTHSNIGNVLLLKQNQESKFTLIVGANELRANLLLADLQVHLEYNERIIKDFGKQVSYGDWSKGMFETADGCFFMAIGIDQPFRGLRRYANRIDYAVVDDVEDREVANNPRRVRQRSEKILSDLGGAFSKNRKRLVISNNLITNTGVVKYLINKLGDSPYTKMSMVNIVDKKGKPTWHQRYTPEDIKIERGKVDAYTWSREFMNAPVEEGKIFQEKWMLYTKLPNLMEMEAITAYCDLSYKDTGDFKAVIILGKQGRNFYLIDCFVRQTSRTEVAGWLYDTYTERHLERYPITYYVEGLFAQDDFINDFDSEGDARGFYIPIILDKKTKTDKYNRIESMVGFWERGNVFINEKLKDTMHLKNFLSQLLAFEKGSTANDDAPDAFQSALAELNRSTTSINVDDLKLLKRNKTGKHSY